MKSYKIGWQYAKNYKLHLVATIIFLILFQFFNMLSPLIIQRLIDDYLVGIEYSWTQVDVENEKAVEYNGNYYQQTHTIDDGVATNSVILLEGDYYFSEEVIPQGYRELSGDSVIVDGNSYQVVKLSEEEVNDFYQPMIPEIINLLLLLLVTSIGVVVFMYLQRLTASLLIAEMTRDVRLDAMKKISFLPIEKVETEPAGKMANRVLNDSIGISKLYTTTINIFMSAGLSMFFSYVGMFILNPKLAMICLLIIPVLYVWAFVFVRYINKIAINVNETNSRIVGMSNEIVNGIQVLKVFNARVKTLTSFDKLNKRYMDQSLDEVSMHVKYGWNGVNLFQGLAGAAIIIFFGYQNIQGNVVVGAGVIYAYYNYLMRLIAPLGMLFQEISALEHAKVQTDRVNRIVNSELESDEFIEISKYEGLIEFKDLSFSYEKGEPILKGINIKIKPGEKVGLVGRTGSGKSTMMNLLLRFNDLEDIDNGDILIDNKSIYTHSKKTYRQHIGIILQEPIIFSGTLEENISFGIDMDKEEVKQLLIDIGGEFIINKFDEGIDHVISRACDELSLGEKQLVSFARILALNPSIIVMDEATANIDTKTEQKIISAIEKIAKDRTMIIIAHRLSTIVDADKIIVLDAGEIIESGTHNELIDFDKHYANMYRAQVN